MTAFLTKISVWMTGTDVYQTLKRKEYMAGEVREDKLLADAVVIDGWKEWYSRFSSETNVWSRVMCRRCKTDCPPGSHGQPWQALSTRNEHNLSASSSSCGGGDHIWVYTAQWAKEAESWELRHKVTNMENERKKPLVQFEEQEEDAKSEENGKMEVDEETHSRKMEM